MNKIIHSEEELKWFHENVVAELKISESHFVSLSARNKYLTAKERVEFGLGRTEMFERRVIRTNEWDNFLRTFKKFEVAEGAYTTKTGMNIPTKTIVCYFNINPSDSVKAHRDFNKVMNEYVFELTQCAINDRDMSNIMYRINKQPTLLMNSYQKATGSRHWLDFDFDVPKDFLPYLELYAVTVKHFGGRSYIIDTKSGFHLLISKDTNFSKDFNPSTIVAKAVKDVKHYFNSKYPNGTDVDFQKFLKGIEIIHNSNQMIPTPGTFQGGYKVTILNKDK